MAEINDGLITREYVYLDGVPLALLDANGASPTRVYMVHTDQLGAAVKVTDETGAIVWNVKRRPFGEREMLAEQIEVPFGFPGQYYDQESGLFYNYFRDYDPSTGRYIESDPIGLDGGINTYAYVGGNPLRYSDPLGLRYVGQPGKARGSDGLGEMGDFQRGFTDFFNDLYGDLNPFPPGSCQYNRREIAIMLAGVAASDAARNLPEVLGPAWEVISSSPWYVAGRITGNAVNTAAFAAAFRRLPPNAKMAGSFGLSGAGTSWSNFKKLVKQIENFLDISCESCDLPNRRGR